MALYTLKGMRIILIWVASGRYNRYPTLRTKHFFPDVCFSGGLCQADVWILKGSKTPDAEIVWFSLSQIPHIHLPESFFFWGASRISAHALRTYIPLSSILFTLFGMWYEVGMCGGIWVFSLVFTRGFGVGKPLNYLCTF